MAKPRLLDLYSDLVFPPLVDVGEGWRKKTINVDQEHLASNALREGLARFHAELPRKQSNGLTAVCSCPEGELHDIAIQCVRYYLESEGWNVLFLGQATPTESLVNAIKTRRPALVALSALSPRHDRRLVNAVNRHIYPAAHRVKARLVLGGPGMKARWTGKIKAELLCNAIAECEHFADPKQYAVRH